MSIKALALVVVMLVLVGRVVLAFRFRRDFRARRIGVSTAQMVLVIALAAVYDHLNRATAVAAVVSVLLAIVVLSFIPLAPHKQ